MPVAGSGKRDACKTEACAIQDCLAKNDYDMNNCKDKVDKLKKCCSNNLKESVHCGMVDSRTDTDSGDSQKPDDQVHFAYTMFDDALFHSICDLYLLLDLHHHKVFAPCRCSKDALEFQAADLAKQFVI